MAPRETAELIAIILLVILSALFSMAETAYTSANRIRLKSYVQDGNKKAKKVLALTENYDKLLTAILIGNNIVNLTVASISTIFFMSVLGTKSNYALISTIVITAVILIFSEITPKFIAKNNPEKVALITYPFAVFFTYLFIPFTFIFAQYRKLIGKIFRMKNTDVITEEEIITYVEEAEEDGTFEKEETKLIRSAIEFDDLEVGDILVPRVNIAAVEDTFSMEEIKNVFIKEEYSRLPVYRDSIDTVVGFIHEKDFFNAYLSGKKSIKDILTPVTYTTEHISISQLLKELQKKKTHIAIVLDEYGGTLGLVTLEDVIEELVGEIWDEHDEEVNYFKKLNANTVVVDGKAPFSEMAEYFGIEDEESDASTVSGWVIEKLDEIPRAGKKFEYKDLKIEVTKSTVKKVIEIKVIKAETEKEEE